MFGPPLDQFISVVDPEACHLRSLPNRIWVFGGPVETDSDDACKSLRDSFWRQTLNHMPTAGSEWIARIDRPENHKEWWAFSGYDNLLQFERDACYLAQATVLFAESPGALAELGALAIDDYLVKNLIVILQTKYLNSENRESFLNLGPLKRVKDNCHLCVIGVADNIQLPVEDYQSIIESIGAWLPPLQKTQIFKIDNPTHRLLLLADLIDLFLVAKTTELKAAAKYLGVNYTDLEISKALKLLEFFDLIRMEGRGLENFFTSQKKSEAPWLDYTALGAGVFNRSRFKVDAIAWVESQPRLKSIWERVK